MPELSDIIESDVSDVFLAPGGFAEYIRIYPRGNMKLSPEATRAIWDADALPGSNEVPGDGRALNKPNQRSDRKSIILEMSINEPISETQDDRAADVIERVKNCEIVTVKRILGTDAGMMSVLCIRQEIVNRSKGSVNG